MFNQNFYDKALSAAGDAVVIIDASGKILFASPQVFSVLGYSPDELLGQQVEILLPRRLWERHFQQRDHYRQNPWERPLGGLRCHTELSALCKNRVEIPVEVSLTPYQDNQQALVVATVRDITERKRIVDELREARETADRASEVKSRFLATASHDLRQPLQALSLLTGSLQRMTTDKQLLEVAAQQQHAIETMSELLDTLLDISKLEAGAINPSLVNFHVKELFDGLRTEFLSLARNKGLQLQVATDDLSVYSDPVLIGQILRNLLSNAIKYTSEGLVRLYARGENSCVRIAIIDSGVGIPAEQLPFIYDDFFQGDLPAQGRRNGYGLGLSIVRRLTQLLGVRLEIMSEVGRGTTCVVEIPLNSPAKDGDSEQQPRQAPKLGNGQTSTYTAPTLEAEHVAVAPTAARELTILLVDDDTAVRQATAMLLRVEGWQVLDVSSLDDAVELARKHPDIDLIVSDYYLQGTQTGIQVIDAVRNIQQRCCNAVLVTGDTSITMRAQQTKGIHLVSKPINADEFTALIQGLH